MKILNKYKQRVLILIGIGLLFLTVWFVINEYIGVSYAIELTAGQTGISLDQAELFNISNMFPGQPPTEAKKPLKVKNIGDSDFQCKITSKLTSDNTKLYDILKLSILDDKGSLIYSGGLRNLNQLTLGTISPGKSKVFDFMLELPKEVDNSYQALKTSFQFNIEASGGSDGQTGLPTTGTYVYYLIPIGVILLLVGIKVFSTKAK